MRPEAHKSLGSAPNCGGIVSMTHRRDTNAHMRANRVLVTVPQYHQRNALTYLNFTERGNPAATAAQDAH
eukprot:7292028-Prymnesium_polylepis.1